MSDITPKPIVAVAGLAPSMSTTATAAPPTTATAAEIPAAVANLSVGTVVTGTVIERGARGLVVLRTDKGTIKLQSPIPLRQGSTVTLQIQSVGAQTQLSILSIDGNPLGTSSSKLGPAAARPDNLMRPAGTDTATRVAPTPNHPAQQTSPGTSMTSDNATPRPGASERGGLARPTMAAPNGPAGAFVARPLIGPTGSAGLEAFTAQQSATPASAVVPGAIPTSLASTSASGAPAPVLTAGDKFLAAFIAAPPGSVPPSSDGTARSAITPLQNPPPEKIGLATSAASLATSAPLTPPSSPIAAPVNPAPVSPVPASLMVRLIHVEAPIAAPMTGSLPAIAVAPQATGMSQTIVGTIIPSTDAPSLPTALPGAAAKTLISTPLGVLSLPGAAPGPLGTRLVLEVMPSFDMPPAAVHRPELASSLVAPASGRGQEWAVLRDIVTATTVADPAVADHLLNVTLPRVGPNFAAGLLAFVAALRQNEPRAWLGQQTIDALRHNGHGGLIEKLGDEFAALNRLAADISPGGWQTLLVPLFDGERIQQIRMYMRRARRKNGERGGTRFIIEAELTKLGPVQLDGLISKPQFDLVVRTRAGLPPTMRGDIIEIFGDALLATHLKGAVMFQVSADLRPGPPDNDGEAGIGLIV